MTAPGDWRVLQSLRAVARDAGLELELRDDRHFYTTVRDFAAHANGRKTLRLEYFYRELRKRHDILMEGGKPLGGQWNFDAENRGSFDAEGPRDVPEPTRFEPDALTREVLDLVDSRLDGLDESQIPVWVQTLGESIAELRKLRNTLRRRLS